MPLLFNGCPHSFVKLDKGRTLTCFTPCYRSCSATTFLVHTMLPPPCLAVFYIIYSYKNNIPSTMSNIVLITKKKNQSWLSSLVVQLPYSVFPTNHSLILRRELISHNFLHLQYSPKISILPSDKTIT